MKLKFFVMLVLCLFTTISYCQTISIQSTNQNTTNIIINGKITPIVTNTTYTAIQHVTCISHLYQSPLPKDVILSNVKVVNCKTDTTSITKSYVEVSDASSTKTILCWYFYSQFPYKPIKGSFINIWGQVWATPKIDVGGIVLSKKPAGAAFGQINRATTTLGVIPINISTNGTTLVKIQMNNVQTITPPFTMTATMTYLDSQNNSHTTSVNSNPIQLIKPITIDAVTIFLPSSLTYVEGSGNIGGTPINVAVIDGVLIADIKQTLLEQQSIIISMQLKSN